MGRLAHLDHKVEIRAAILVRACVLVSLVLAARKDKGGVTSAIRAEKNRPEALSPTR